ncbi:MAG: hypothetical protein Q8P46_06960 [Hyphomicrobiales bacterium]|nr:hypothetical protein [Hyphomicrobiales bacterium]
MGLPAQQAAGTLGPDKWAEYVRLSCVEFAVGNATRHSIGDSPEAIVAFAGAFEKFVRGK